MEKKVFRLIYADIPVRMWHVSTQRAAQRPVVKRHKGADYVLNENPRYAKVMDEMGKMLQTGASVTMTHRVVNALPGPRLPYDTVTIVIEKAMDSEGKLIEPVETVNLAALLSSLYEDGVHV